MPASDAAAAVSAVAVTAHAAGALLLALTFSYLSRLPRVPARNDLRRWALAWFCLLIAILAVRAYLAFAGRAFWVIYLVAE